MAATEENKFEPYIPFYKNAPQETVSLDELGKYLIYKEVKSNKIYV